jgi:two-component system cell cycle sensor histidine kinase/response regulator CckA
MPSRSLPATVLVVDDEPAMRRLLRRQLEALGCTVLEAESGREALRLLLGHRGTLDLVLSDVVMPEMNGTELADRILADSPEQCIVLMSGHVPGGLTRIGRRERIVPIMRKPFLPDQLREVVSLVLERHKPVVPQADVSSVPREHQDAAELRRMLAVERTGEGE